MLTLLALVAALQPMSPLLGEWTCTERYPDGHANQARMTVQPAFDGTWLELRFEQLSIDKPARGVEYWGWDGKRFVELGLNNLGVRETGASDGWRGNELTWRGEARTGEQVIGMRAVFRRDSTGTLSNHVEVETGGHWRAAEDVTCHR